MLIAAFASSALAQAGAAPTDDVVSSLWGGYRFAEPAGWGCTLLSKSSARAMCTRVGFSTHLLESNRIYKEDADNFIGVDVRQPIAIADLAQAFITRRLADDPGLKLVESREVTLNGMPAFRAEFSSVNSQGLRLRTVAWGLTTPDGLYLFTYRAPELTFFQADLPAIEGALDTLKVMKPMRP